MQVLLDIDAKYGTMLTFTAVGVSPGNTDVMVAAIDLTKNTYCRVDENGKAHFVPKEVNQ